MMNQKSLVKGHVYVIQITGVVGKAIAEVVDFDCYDRAMVKVLNQGVFHDAVLKRQDYLAEEHFADSVNSQQVQAALAPG